MQVVMASVGKSVGKSRLFLGMGAKTFKQKKIKTDFIETNLSILLLIKK